MAGTKISALTELATLAAGDLFVTVDVSDTSEAGTGTDKKITGANLATYLAGSITTAIPRNLVAASGSTESLNTAGFALHDVTMDTACTFTFATPHATGTGTAFTLILRGAFTPTFPASVDWGDATPPTYTTPSVYTFLTDDGGTNWFGFQQGKAFG